MNNEKRIITPDDPEWSNSKLPSLDQEYQAPVTPKLPDEVLEAAFSEAVTEVQNMISEGGPVTPEEAPAATIPKEPEPPKASYRFHSPARNRSIPIPMPKPIVVTLTEDLPKSWERKCYVGGIDYIPVEGQDYKQRVRRPGFRKGDSITLSSMVYFPGAGVLYGFVEGLRGGYGVRQDQVLFPETVPNIPIPEEVHAEEPTNNEVIPNATVAG